MPGKHPQFFAQTGARFSVKNKSSPHSMTSSQGNKRKRGQLRHARLPRGSPFVLKATRLVAAGRAQRKNPLKILTSLASPLSLTLMKMWTRAAHSLAAAPHPTRSQADPGQTVPGHLTRTVAACTRRGAAEVRPSCTRTTRTKARTMCVRRLIR